jgi:hypothetical protein
MDEDALFVIRFHHLTGRIGPSMKKRFAIAGVRDGGVLPERSTVILLCYESFFR